MFLDFLRHSVLLFGFVLSLLVLLKMTTVYVAIEFQFSSTLFFKTTGLPKMWKRAPKQIFPLSYRSCATIHLPKNVNNDMPKAYSPALVEGKWYEWWESNLFFKQHRPSSSSEKFSMVLPPPNITGTLHIGHALTCAIQDSLVCWNRMNGKDTYWFPGCDHAGIATQAIVEKNLKFQNLSREQLGRDKFVEEIWKWKHEKQDIIYQQLKGLGSTLNWDKAVFTMDPKLCYAVNEAFIRLHQRGKIYRKESLVNWSCQLRSAISDIEVDHQSIDGPQGISVPGYDKPVTFGYIYKFDYKLSDSDERIAVSTTRPETILGDMAIAVNPEDVRYSKYIGRSVIHPIRHDKLPIIADSTVDREFGTGAVKVTPAHDQKDYEIAMRHGIEMLSIFDNQGIANKNCSEFSGLPRFELREKMIQFLRDNNLLKSILPHQMSVPVCSRSGDVVEPLLRPQWFVDTQEMAQRAMEAVKSGNLKIHPPHFENIWFEWLGNIRDWCISRQLWWGHRVPAYRFAGENDATWIAAHNFQQAVEFAKHQNLPFSTISQDEDVLDTWFSSSLFPFSVCGWPEQTIDLKNLFPLNLMETGHDILFFWVARMVMMSLELTGELPFKEVLLHGIICDSQGRKMSKSLGNVIDPLDIVYGSSLKCLEDQVESSLKKGHLSSKEFEKAMSEKRVTFPDGIPQTGADALRFTLCSYNVKSHFINLDMSTLKKNRLFCNKIWQATRFLFQLLDETFPQKSSNDIYLPKDPIHSSLMNQWIMNGLDKMVSQVNSAMSRYDFHHATDALYTFLYGSLCDVYLEGIKPLIGVDKQESAHVLAMCLDVALRCLAPFMPFLSEELYQRLHKKLADHGIQSPRSMSILIAKYPLKDEFALWRNAELEQNVDLILRVVTELRNVKVEYGLAKSKPEAILICPSENILSKSDQYSKLMTTIAGLESVTICGERRLQNSKEKVWVSRTVDICSVHVNIAGKVDRRAELKKNQDKMRKLGDKLTRMEANMNSSSYRLSAPSHVQDSHRQKADALRNEINSLKLYAQKLEEL